MHLKFEFEFKRFGKLRE